MDEFQWKYTRSLILLQKVNNVAGDGPTSDWCQLSQGSDWYHMSPGTNKWKVRSYEPYREWEYLPKLEDLIRQGYEIVDQLTLLEVRRLTELPANQTPYDAKEAWAEIITRLREVDHKGPPAPVLPRNSNERADRTTTQIHGTVIPRTSLHVM